MPLSDLDLFRRLVAIDSTSAVTNFPILNELANYLVDSAESVEIIGAHDEEKANLLIRFGPEAEGGLILSGHMDAVPANESDWESDPFTLTEKDDRYVGRGAADMKGFLALTANAALGAGALKKPLYLLYTYDEEVGTLGAKRFAEVWDRARPLPKHCVIGEPTSFRSVRAHKGHLKLRFTTSGRSAHSGYPHLGENAIEKALPLLEELSSLRRELEHETTEHADLFADAPYVPLNIATIHGGSAVNIVPDRCTIDVGIRLLPGMTTEAMLKRVPRDAEILSESPPMLLAETSAIYEAVQPHATKGRAESVSFASDAGWLQSLGIECLLFGPGAIEVAHKANEFMPKGEFHRAAPILRELIARFCA